MCVSNVFVYHYINIRLPILEVTCQLINGEAELP